MIEVIKNKTEWNKLVNSMPNCDCYHTYDYHQLSKKENEIPVLLKFEKKSQIILIPLLIRNIVGTVFKDATSAYGYPGPLGYNIPSEFDNSEFHEELEEFLIENNIVSVFSRLNPFISQQEIILKDMGEISSPGKIINIDLTKNLEHQKSDYQKRLRTYINKARRECEAKTARSRQEVLEFIQIYHDNMRRKNATEEYLFSEEYFFSLLNSTDFNAEVLLAKDKASNEIMGGVIFIKKNDVVQYHLSGVKEEFLKFNSIKFLIDEMRIRATAEGYTFFNLGGGVASKEDSLFSFKSSFSKDHRAFKVWKFVVNTNLYNELVANKTKENKEMNFEQCNGYFPLYRCKLLENHTSVNKA